MKFKKFGKYTIIKKLASGGMADILLASDLSPTGFGRFVVIKRALSKFSENEEFKDMFKNEGKVACNLKHRNITPIYEFGIENNQFYLSMEYISGRNLREFIKKLQAHKKPMSIPDSVHVIKEVASGLNYAHNAIDTNTGQPLNLIHRDISPQNIMLSFDGEVKLIDFGIAKIADTNLTRAGHLKGKFSYMSPEQANGETLDERTDIFCLGIILWEMLAGKRLFASPNELSTLKKVKNCDVPNIQRINPQVPNELGNIIKKALSKNKNSRYKTAAKLEQDLSVFLNKNYPKYSHYDFISIIKQVYRKDIMEERESLKTYSAKFKKYINSLNIEESMEGKTIYLNLPDLSTIDQTNPTKTKKTLSGENSLVENEQSSSEHKSHSYIQKINQADSSKPKSKTMEKHKITLIKKNEDGTRIEQIKKQKAEQQKELLEKDIITQNMHITNNKTDNSMLNSKVKLMNEPEDFFKASQTARFTKSSTSDNKKTASRHFNNTQTVIEPGTSKSLLLLFPLLIFLVGFFFIAYMVINEKDIVAFIKKSTIYKVIYKVPAISFDQKPIIINDVKSNSLTVEAESSNNSRNPTALTMQMPVTTNRKIFIHSKPSGGKIFINDQFTAYTPSVVTLSANNSSKIKIKKKGYLIKKHTFNPKTERSNSLNLILTVDETQKVQKKIKVIQ